MAEAPLVQRISAIINGISRQAPTLRHPTHCENAENVTFSVIDGFSKRGGNEFVGELTGSTRTIEYRMHKFERDQELEFVIVHGPGVFKVMSLSDGTTQPLTISAVADAYISFGSPAADDIRLVTIADSNFVVNTLRTPQTTGPANEIIDPDRMPMLLVRNDDGTWDMDSRTWNERPKNQQILVRSGTPTGGTFKLAYKGVKTAAIAYNATNEDIDDALEEVSTIGQGKVTTFGGPVHLHDVVMNLSPDLTDIEMMTIANSTITGASLSIERGSDVTNPAPTIIKDELGIRDISYFRNRIILGGDERIVMSQIDDLFNFYHEDGNIIIDSDPIDFPLAAQDVTLIDYIVPHGDTVIVMTTAGQQFQLQGSEILSPSTVSITPSTRHESQPVRPVVMGDNLYFAGQHKGYSILYEYTYNPDMVSYHATDITKHVFDLIPPNMVALAASANNETLIVVPRNDINESSTTFTSNASGNWSDSIWDGGSGAYDSPQPWDTAIISSGHTVTFTGYAPVTPAILTSVGASTLYLYRRYQKGNELIQSAWAKWTMGENETADNIMDVITVDNDVFILTRDDEQGDGVTTDISKLFLWKVTLTEERTAETGFPFNVLLDHKRTFDAWTSEDGGNQYTYLMDEWDSAIDTVVLSNDWSNPGEVVTVLAATRDGATGNREVKFVTTATATSGASKVIVGRAYDGLVEFSTVNMRDENNTPISAGKTIIQKVIVDHYNAGPYKIIITDNSEVGRADREVSFIPSGHSEAFGTSKAWVHGRARDTAISVKISEPKPCTISAVEYHGQYGSLLEA